MTKKETKSFMMKANGKSYTISFSMDSSNGMTTVDMIDMETPRLSFAKRLKIAAGLLFGKLNLGELIFPIRLRNIDFYNYSFIYRPEKKVEVKAQPIEESAPKTRKSRPRSKKKEDAA